VCDRLCSAGEEAVLVNINEPLDATLARWPGAVFFVQADTFAPASPNAASHPERYGLRGALEEAGVPFVGSRAAAVARSSSGDKVGARETLRASLGVPAGRAAPAGRSAVDEAAALAAELGLPVVLKAASDTGGSRGVVYAGTEARLARALEGAWASFEEPPLVEEYVAGREFTVWVFEERGQPEAYGVAELVRPPSEPILSRRLKRFAADAAPVDGPFARMLIDPEIPPADREHIAATAVAAHRALGLRHYSRIDLLVRDGEPLVIDANAKPPFIGVGAFAAARGEQLSDVLLQLVEEARRTV
jgi:D-alanine-D-alanine ligase